MKKLNHNASTKKLKLAKESLRRLSRPQLMHAVGGTVRLTKACTDGCTDTD